MAQTGNKRGMREEGRGKKGKRAALVRDAKKSESRSLLKRERKARHLKDSKAAGRGRRSVWTSGVESKNDPTKKGV
jgi:hypothetical protein